MSDVEISIVLACYNEGPTLESNVQKIITQLEKLAVGWEVIFVEDGSRDGTRAKVLELSNRIKNSRVILHRKNKGRGRSVKDGLKASRGTICGFLDIDCEIAPSYIPLFLKKISEGNDMVVARRRYRTSLNSLARMVASKVYALVVSILLDLPIRDTEAGFKFFRRKKILPVLAKSADPGWFWDTEICFLAHRSGLNISEILVSFIRSKDKKSTVRLIPDSIQYLRKIFQFRHNQFRRR